MLCCPYGWRGSFLFGTGNRCLLWYMDKKEHRNRLLLAGGGAGVLKHQLPPKKNLGGGSPKEAKHLNAWKPSRLSCYTSPRLNKRGTRLVSTCPSCLVAAMDTSQVLYLAHFFPERSRVGGDRFVCREMQGMRHEKKEAEINHPTGGLSKGTKAWVARI